MLWKSALHLNPSSLTLLSLCPVGLSKSNFHFLHDSHHVPTLFVKTRTVPPVPQKIVDTPSIIRKSLHRKWSQLAVDKLNTTKRNVRNSKDNWFPAAQPAWLAGIQKKWRHLRAWFVTKMNSLPSPRWRPCWCCHFLLVSRCGFFSRLNKRKKVYKCCYWASGEQNCITKLNNYRKEAW